MWRGTSKLLDRFQLRQNKIKVVINGERNEVADRIATRTQQTGPCYLFSVTEIILD
jgi:hypothetical protein